MNASYFDGYSDFGIHRTMLEDRVSPADALARLEWPDQQGQRTEMQLLDSFMGPGWDSLVLSGIWLSC